MRITSEDYESLKAFFGWMLKHVIPPHEGLAAEHYPLAVLEGFESQSMAIARKGLGHAIGDMVEMTDASSPEQVRAIDAALVAEGLPTLSAVKARFGRRIRAIMKRGSLRNDDEYYSLRNAVEVMEERERATAWDMLAAFETRAGERRA